ncbi:MAG: DUF3795 domain-containing protein [Thermoplasmata archaeon]|nr:DUF3795 domain-containing protein [Thermoplasmata archaeon]
MADLALIGRCGLFCGACGIYRAYRDGGKLLDKVVKSFDCSPQLVRCEGCQDLTEDCWGNECKVVKCLRKNRLEFCHECDDLEKCKIFSDLSQEYKEIGVDLILNMDRIKRGEAVMWLEKEDKKWRCGSCGKPISYHMEECHQCGAILVGITD